MKQQFNNFMEIFQNGSINSSNLKTTIELRNQSVEAVAIDQADGSRLAFTGSHRFGA